MVRAKLFGSITINSKYGETMFPDFPDIQAPVAPWTALVLQFASLYSLDPKIIAALVYQESKGNSAAHRYEDAFYIKYVAKKTSSTLLGYVPSNSGQLPTLDTEKRDRAYSYGLAQVMGQTARELGYKKNDLLNLCIIPADGLAYGCAYLKKKFDATSSAIPQIERYRTALLGYNGGSDPDYDDKVLSHITSGKYLEIATV